MGSFDSIRLGGLRVGNRSTGRTVYNAYGMSAGSSPDAAPPARPARRSLGRVLAWLRDLAFSVLLAVVLIVFIYQPVKVEGTSMEPSLTDQERIFINKFTFRLGLGGIARGDTVVFHYDENKSYIKRVIALPGDRVRIEAGKVFVNGQPLEEDYVPPEFRDAISWPAGGEAHDAMVPPEMYFVLGDHRSQSSDSRAWGYVQRKSIYGKAVFIYWPPDKIGRLR
jgi:signal peptidase I